MLKKGLLTGALFAALALAVAACGGNNTTPTPSAPPAETPAPPADNTGGEAAGGAETTVDATAVYEANCMGCHATDLSGQGNFPALQTVGATMSKEEIAAKISAGGNGMPAFQGRLSDEEIDALSQWLSEKK